MAPELVKYVGHGCIRTVGAAKSKSVREVDAIFGRPFEGGLDGQTPARLCKYGFDEFGHR